MKKKRDRQAPTSIGKTSAHRSFLFFCRKFSSAFATFLCIRQATSLISRNHHRSFSASDGEPGQQEPGRKDGPTHVAAGGILSVGFSGRQDKPTDYSTHTGMQCSHAQLTAVDRKPTRRHS